MYYFTNYLIVKRYIIGVSYLEPKNIFYYFVCVSMHCLFIFAQPLHLVHQSLQLPSPCSV